MKDSTGETAIASAIVFMLLGPITWAVHFLVIYGGQASACALQVSGSLELQEVYVALFVIVVTALFGAQLGFFAWRPAAAARLLHFDADEEESQAFSTKVMQALALLSLFGVVGSGAAAFMVDACAAIR